VRLEVGLGQDPLDGAAAHVAGVGVPEDVVGEVVQRPVRLRPADVGGLLRGQGEDLVALVRGKNPAAGRAAAALGGQAVDTDYSFWSKPARLDSPAP
jgi:hypothetical protein